jgi:hypothetical protein
LSFVHDRVLILVLRFHKKNRLFIANSSADKSKKASVSEEAPAFKQKSHEPLLRRLPKPLTALNVYIDYQGGEQASQTPPPPPKKTTHNLFFYLNLLAKDSILSKT